MSTAKLVIVGANVEATGHPSACTEPAPGTVESTAAPTVTINGTQVYSKSRGDMVLPSHAHTNIPPCSSFSAHEIDPDNSHAVTVNGKSVFERTDTGTDPDSGGTVSFTGTGGNSSITLTE